MKWAGNLNTKNSLLPLQSTLDSIGVNIGQLNLKISNITSLICPVLFYLNNIPIVRCQWRRKTTIYGADRGSVIVSSGWEPKILYPAKILTLHDILRLNFEAKIKAIHVQNFEVKIKTVDVQKIKSKKEETR